MKGLSLDFSVCSGHSALAFGIVCAVNFHDVAFVVLLQAGAFDDVGVLQAHFLSGSQTHEFLFCHFHEVIAFNPDFAAEGDFVCAVGLVFGIVYGGHLLGLSFGIVGDDNLHRIQYRTYADAALVEVFSDGAFHQFHFIQRVIGGISNLVDELVDALGAVTSSSVSADGGHAGVVPSVHHAFLYQCEQIALAHEGIAQIQLVELGLARTEILNVFGLATHLLHPGYEQVVKRTVLHKLKCAEAVCYAFQIVALAMGEVVHGVGVPLVSGTDVGDVQHAVDQRVAEVHVGVCHVNFGSEHHLARLHVSAVHLLEQGEAFLYGAVAVRALRSG